MQVFEQKGICISTDNASIKIDGPAHEFGAITHAHTDHFSGCNGTASYLMSPETNSLINSRAKKCPTANETIFGKKTTIGDLNVSLHNAGHIPGSAQVLIEGSRTIAVTSDFKLQESMLLKPAQPLKADIIVLETTFGLPSFKFPSREEIYKEMEKWMKEQLVQNNFIILAGYAVGKAQELTKVVNELTGSAPLVHEQIYEANNACKKHGIKLGDYIKLDHNLQESNILIMPPSLVSNHLIPALSHVIRKKVVSASNTGWNFRGRHTKNFPLSDHADFEQLIQYVKESEPGVVLTTHGYAQEFANYISRRMGVAARALNDGKQRAIAEYAEA